jgi:hypothetical protein
MSIFDVIKYPLSDPPARLELAALPSSVTATIAFVDGESAASLYYTLMHNHDYDPKVYNRRMKRMRAALAGL